MSLIILHTSRLYTRPLSATDLPGFFELMGNPNVMDPIPQKTLSELESIANLKELIVLEKTSATKIWCLCIKGSDDFIGLCGVLKNDNNEDEIAYRLLESHWGKGYGTEIAKGLIDYCFDVLHSELVTADVWIENIKSIKILEKFFRPQKEFYNTHDDCMDRRYTLRRADRP